MTFNLQSRVNFYILFLVTLLTAMGNLGLVSIMPAIGRGLAIPDFLIASTFSLSALAWTVTSQFWARKANRFGRKPMLILGLAGFTISMAGCAAVVFGSLQMALPPFVIFIAFVVVRATYGLFGSAAPTAAQAIIADSLSGPDRVKALSYIGGALSLGTILGPAIAPFFIYGRIGFAGPPAAFAFAGVLLLVLVVTMLPADTPIGTLKPENQESSIWSHSTVRPILVNGLVVASSQAINLYLLGFALIDANSSGNANVNNWIGFTMSAGALSSLIGQFILVPVIKPDPHAMLKWGAFVAVLGNLIVVAAFGPWAIAIGFVVACFGYGLARPGTAAAASAEVGPEQQNSVAGAISAIAGASIAVPPIVASLIYQFSPTAPFVLAAACAFWVTVMTKTRH